MRLFSWLRQRPSKPSVIGQTAVIRLFSGEREVYRADLPMEIEEDAYGPFPYLDHLQDFLDQTLIVDQIRVEMRFRQAEAEISLDELQDIINEEKEPPDTRTPEERLEDEQANAAELQIDAEKTEE